MRPLTEIRYRVTRVGNARTPFDPWFVHAPDGRVNGTDIRFDGDRGTGRFVAFPGPETDRDAFFDDVEALPGPNCDVWRVETRTEDACTFLGAWNEPIFPNILSPTKIAEEVLGNDLEQSWTMTYDALAQRVLAPADRPTDGLWPRLRDHLLRFCGWYGQPLAIELERLGPYAPPGLVRFGDAFAVLRAAFALGYYDDPPRASASDVAFVAGVTGREALQLLRRMEKKILDES